MEDFSKYIAPERRAVPTPDDLVKNGECVFGTFDREFKTMNLLDLKHPTHLPKSANKNKCTLWEAMEVHLKQGYMLSVVCDMGVFGVCFCLFFDFRKNKLFQWYYQVPHKQIKVAPNLLNGSEFSHQGKKCRNKYINNLEKGQITQCSFFSDKKMGTIETDLVLTRFSKPSVVSIPFAKDRQRPLYSQKDLFNVKGKIILNGEVFETDDSSMAVIDDHRGYYPRRMHYDWLTFFGVNNGEKIGFNLTRNQSIDQDKYNENLIWLKDDTSLLPPVTFDHRGFKTIKFEGENTPMAWTIKDEHDMVNLVFSFEGVYKNILHLAPIVRIDYFVMFGKITGYIRKENGEKIEFVNADAMAEDKDMCF